LMSGSSLDGLDLAAADMQIRDEDSLKIEWQLLAAETIPFPAFWLERLKGLPGVSGLELAQAHVDFGHLCGKMARDFIKKHSFSPDLIASHGHTVFHFPERKMTCQIGDGAAMAALTGVAVACDFRTTDIALGGQGAPLAPLADRYLFPGHHFYLNLGGIANISILSPSETIAFDIGPANQILNALAAEKGLAFDRGGELARAGELQAEILQAVNKVPYFSRKSPKSIDNQWIQQNILPLYQRVGIPVEDRIHTACEQLAMETGRQVALHLSGLSENTPYSMLVSGGGAHNSYLLERIQAHLPHELTLYVPPKEIVDYKEALLMALMGLFRLERRKNCLQSATGAVADSTGGSIYWGSK
jgi:anhydro-N-acetylmuramic acid kinase